MDNKKQSTKKPENIINAGMLDEEIRERARQIYLLRKPEAGDALSDWLQAEKEIKLKYKIK